MTIQEWLDTECQESELKYNPDGSCFIPIRVIEGPTKLGNKYFIKDWQLLDVKSQAAGTSKVPLYNMFGRLQITFTDGTVSSKPGGVSMLLTNGSNINYEATAISEVIKNAAKRFGKQFGFHLNQDMGEDLQKESSGKEVIKYDLETLTRLNDEYFTKIPKDEQIAIARIISNKEENSYEKAIKLILEYGNNN